MNNESQYHVDLLPRHTCQLVLLKHQHPFLLLDNQDASENAKQKYIKEKILRKKEIFCIYCI